MILLTKPLIDLLYKNDLRDPEAMAAMWFCIAIKEKHVSMLTCKIVYAGYAGYINEPVWGIHVWPSFLNQNPCTALPI